MENSKGLNKSPGREEIIQYLSYIVELEKSLLLQTQAMKGLEDQMAKLGHPNRYQKPTPPQPYSKSEITAGIGVMSIIGIILGIAFYVALNSLYFVFLFFLGMGIIGVIISTKDTKEQNKEYEASMEVYNQQLKSDQNRVSNELRQKEELSLARDQLYKQHLSTKETLSQAYAVGVIYNKYRSFPAVASFLDYFNSGRCSTLGENRGGDGAYNTYEQEVRMDLIVAKLDQALVKLDSIRDNQWTLYTAISEGNELSKQLVDNATRIALSAEATAENSAIAAYNAQRSADDINIIKWMQIFKDK